MGRARPVSCKEKMFNERYFEVLKHEHLGTHAQDVLRSSEAGEIAAT